MSDRTTIHGEFERQAIAHRNAVAVVGETDRLTYTELDRRANGLAHLLRGLGVGPEVPVAVCLRRTPMLVAALLAVLKADGAYLPLDPGHPDERLEFIRADAGAGVLLTDDPGRRLGAARVVRLTHWDDLGPAADSPPAGIAVTPDNLAYVIYTSGSTGAPKGVMVEHRHVTALLRATADRFRLGPEDVWSLFAPASFDFSVWEMWGALLTGGRLIVVPEHVRRSPEEFCALLRDEGVTVLSHTPAAFRQLIPAERTSVSASPLQLRLVILGGEALPLEMLRPWLDRHGGERPELVNMYGITETTVHSTLRRITTADLDTAVGSVIGEPIDGWTGRVLAPDGLPVPDGDSGEFVIGGAGVTRGYLGRPGLTAERFRPDPDSAVPGARRYHSGDVVRRLADGDHVYLGRRDHQVKIRGHRIEPGEIETVLSRHPAVREAVVVALPDPAGALRLVAYWAGDHLLDDAPLRAHLRRALPEYMLPSRYVELGALPLTPNGKVDRRALPAPETADPRSAEGFAAPATPLEKAVAQIWADALSLRQVGLDDDFFELGGHSMLAVAVLADVRERLGVRATLRLLFDRPTVRQFAGVLEEQD